MFMSPASSPPTRVRFIDSIATLLQLQDFAVANDWRVPVFIKIDAGNKRAGVPDADALDITRAAAALETGGRGSVQFLGIYSHSGHAYACTCLAESRACAAEEFHRMSELRSRLEASGIGVPVVSVGSVPNP
jgi:D-serine deaminase-like pyridoxal phosphate-dependent protein